MFNNRKALVVGIDDYPTPLHGCCNDAMSVSDLLSRNEDGSANFSVQTKLNVTTKGELLKDIKKCFEGDCDIALFYFSGHGHVDLGGGYLVTPDYSEEDWGVSLETILAIATKSSCKNKVIILDCCHSGKMGEITSLGENNAVIGEGLTVLSSSRRQESSLEVNGHGVFTSLFVEALNGSAADITGCITPGSVYAYIDKALGPWEQRPVFKTNVNSFISLRKVIAPITLDSLKMITSIFADEDALLNLDPSFEPTNTPSVDHRIVEPYAVQKNTKTFELLQKYVGVGLVKPVGADHMYFAAMESKQCRLTELGKQYWRLANSGIL